MCCVNAGSSFGTGMVCEVALCGCVCQGLYSTPKEAFVWGGLQMMPFSRGAWACREW